MADRLNNAMVLTQGTTWVELLPSPSPGTKRVITALNFYNADTVAVSKTYAALYDGSTYWMQDTWVSISPDRTAYILSLEQAWIQKNGQSLMVKLDAAVTTNECQFTVHYLDEIYEGERIVD